MGNVLGKMFDDAFVAIRRDLMKAGLRGGAQKLGERAASEAADKVAKRGAADLAEQAVKGASKSTVKRAEETFGRDALLRTTRKTAVRQAIDGADKASKVAADARAATKGATKAAKDATAVAQDASKAGSAAKGAGKIIKDPITGPNNDLPAINQQISQDALQQTPQGTLVKKLPVPGQTKKVTFVSLKALNNDLDPTMPLHINELEKTGSDKNVNVLAFGDDQTSTRAYYIRKDADPATVTSPYVTPAGPSGHLDMSQASSVQQGVALAHDQFPSQTLWVDQNDHGGLDRMNLNGPNNGQGISEKNAAAMLAGNGGKKIDLVSADACLQSDAVDMYAYRNATRYTVASEDETFPLGLHHDEVLADVEAQGLTDPTQIANSIFQHAKFTGTDEVLDPQMPADGVQAIYHLSLIDNSKMEPVATAADNLGSALNKALPSNRPAIMQSISSIKPLYVASHPGGFGWNEVDINQLGTQLQQNVNDPAVKQAAQQLMDAATGPNGAVVRTQSAVEDAGITNGMSIPLPTDGNIDPDFAASDFAKAAPNFMSFLQSLKPAAATT